MCVGVCSGVIAVSGLSERGDWAKPSSWREVNAEHLLRLIQIGLISNAITED